MKKKGFIVVFIIAVAIVAGYNMYQSRKIVGLSNLVVANIEALANDDEVKLGYEVTTSQCPYPVEYKTSVSCSSGGEEPECSASDC